MAGTEGTGGGRDDEGAGTEPPTAGQPPRPPSFGPSTRAGREHPGSGKPEPRPVPPAPPWAVPPATPPAAAPPAITRAAAPAAPPVPPVPSVPPAPPAETAPESLLWGEPAPSATPPAATPAATQPPATQPPAAQPQPQAPIARAAPPEPPARATPPAAQPPATPPPVDPVSEPRDFAPRLPRTAKTPLRERRAAGSSRTAAERERERALRRERAAAGGAAVAGGAAAAGTGGRDRSRGGSPSSARRGAPSRRAAVDAAARALDALRGLPRAAIAAIAGVVVVIGGVLALGGGNGSGTKPPAKATTKAAAARRAKSPYGPPTTTALPPTTRLVAYTGAPQADVFGILGTMPFAEAAKRLSRQAVPYERKSRPVLHGFDLIATIANAHPGPASKYRTRQSSTVIARYLRAARRAHGDLILDIQPGTSNFVDETKALRRWLREPDVQLALDPEWRMRPGVVPGSQIGWVSGGEIQATLALVAKIVRDNGLPPKMVLVHRFTDGMIRDLASVKVPTGIVPVISVDGVGSRPLKISTYNRIAPSLPKPWLPGFKLFYVEDQADGGIMSGKQVMALKPRPHVVIYE